ATVLGTAQAFDIPARQAFIFEMVEGTDILNAVGLNSTIVNVARLLGPAIAGAAITWVGMAWAFLANGLSFIPVILALLLLGPRPGFLFGGALVLTLANIALGAIHRFHAAAVVLGVAGASMVVFTATVNTTLQLGTPDRLRGRMMAVYSLVMGGMTPVGALVSGTLAQLWGASGAFGIGGLMGLAALGGVARWRLRTARRDSPSAAGAAPLWDAAGGDG